MSVSSFGQDLGSDFNFAHMVINTLKEAWWSQMVPIYSIVMWIIKLLFNYQSSDME
jgi:hypothetical protein